MFTSPCALPIQGVYACGMKMFVGFVAYIVLYASVGFAAPKQHVVALGKWTSIKWLAEDDEGKATDLRIRPLYVDGRTREFTVGPAHDVTERAFVVQRMFRLNDSLPTEIGPPRWRWERGGWLLTDRVTGKVQPLTLPEFDPYSASVSWFRDYAAYCGVSDDGSKFFAMIVQLGKRKPLLKKALGDSGSGAPTCPLSTWQRNPVRVTFQQKSDQKLTFSVRSRTVDLAIDDESEGEEAYVPVWPFNPCKTDRRTK